MGEFPGELRPEICRFRPLWEAENGVRLGFTWGGGLISARRGAVGLQTGDRVLRRRKWGGYPLATGPGIRMI